MAQLPILPPGNNINDILIWNGARWIATSGNQVPNGLTVNDSPTFSSITFPNPFLGINGDLNILGGRIFIVYTGIYYGGVLLLAGTPSLFNRTQTFPDLDGTFGLVNGGQAFTNVGAITSSGVFTTTGAGSNLVIAGTGNSTIAGGLGLSGATPDTNNVLNIAKNQNALTQIKVSNTTVGTSSLGGISLFADGTPQLALARVSTGWTTYGAVVANSSYILENGPVGLTLMADNSTGVIKFTTGGNAERARIDATGNYIGTITEAQNAVLQPVGVCPPINATTAFVMTDTFVFFVYIGRIPQAITTIDVMYKVTTAGVAIDFAEVGIFKGAVVFNGNASLSRLGFTSVSGVVNSTGIKKTTVALSGVTAGDDLWAAIGSQTTTTPPQIRGTVADELQLGVFQNKGGQLSTLSTPVTTNISAGTAVIPWLVAKW